MFGKLLTLLSLGGTLSGVNLAEKFVSVLLTIIALTIVASVITGSLVVFAFYECYEVLVRHGLDPDAATLFTCVLGVITVFLIGTVAAYKTKKLHTMPVSVSRAEHIAVEALSALRGFYRGLMDKEF